MFAGDLTDTYAAALLEVIAREEVSGRRSARLTEPGQATWQRFRGRLGNADLLRLLAEDGAVVHPLPFSASRVGMSLDDLGDEVVDQFIAELPSADLKRSSSAYIEAQALRLGLPTKLARSDLHQLGLQPAELALPADARSHALIAFWQETDAETGARRWSFTTEEFAGELMGDLYQQLDPVVGDRHGLYQTPGFVRDLGADKVRLLDPACGSGHFLLDAMD